MMDLRWFPLNRGSKSAEEPSKSYAYGIGVLNKPAAPTVDIVFVHGLTGNRESTWTDKRSNLYWPERLLPSALPNARILTFGYDADVIKFWEMTSQNRLANHAQNLVAALAGLRARTKTTSLPIIFVAHSLGGLVVEDALLQSKNSAEPHLCEILEYTRAIAFLGTPHCGTDIAKWAVIAANFAGLFKQPNKPILRVLEPQSEVLSRIQQEFQSMIRARGRGGKQPIDITCFYEEVPVSVVGKLIVPMHSAILPAYPAISIHSNHTDMTKFENAQDTGYVAILDELLRWTLPTEVQGLLSRPAMSRNVTSATPARSSGHDSSLLGPANSELPRSAPSFRHSNDAQLSNFFATSTGQSGRSVENLNHPNRRGESEGSQSQVRDILRRAVEGSHTASTQVSTHIGPSSSRGLAETQVILNSNVDDTVVETAVRSITFWRSGFTIERSPLRPYADAGSKRLFKSIQQGIARKEVFDVRAGQPVELKVFDRRDEDP